VLVQGARPLFFLDYVASSRLDAKRVAEIVEGMSDACRVSGCVILGGETAEMPGVYADGAFDIAGTLVGVVERADLLPRPTVSIGDVLIGLASNGPHTNGYSLLRRVFSWASLDQPYGRLDRSLADALLEPHRSYLPVLGPILRDLRLKALVHVTGGGLVENVPRVLPQGLDATIRVGSWPVPALFSLVAELTTMHPMELHRALNMGIGMVLVVARDDASAIRERLGEESWIIGELVPSKGHEPCVRLSGH
ncbi:MAG: phosphoribosylformylglycinamidine cyclo-ligase, partial [Proteobacteria bacterium]|nr:phosphoribosylformylglycinamidine cyclo-ligase [Pseudomonadota bacterium]